jgi:aspartate/methionine/tyrosine aminotransferase
MTGWRIGYTAGPEEIISAMSNIQSQSTSNPTSISQKASVEALIGPQEEVKKMVSAFAQRRNYIVERLNEIPGVSCFKPIGAFYVFPNFSEYYENHPPQGRIYLPTASYFEMLQWALPTESGKKLERIVDELKQQGKFEEYSQFFKGGFFRNFMVKYDGFANQTVSP